jgi:hypothetical protein
MEVKTLTGQSLFDVALQTTGSIETVFAIAAANGLSVTDQPKAGTILNVPAATVKKVTEHYRAAGLAPATALAADDVMEGIEFWDVEYDFKVS